MTPTTLVLLLATALAAGDKPGKGKNAGKTSEGGVTVGPVTSLALEVGPVTSVARKEVVGIGELELSPCVATAAPMQAQKPVATAGAVALRVTLKRGEVRLVTTTSVDPGLEWLTPCLERRITAHSWPVQQGVFDIPVTLGGPGELDRSGAP
jgi:hypothetical protein